MDEARSKHENAHHHRWNWQNWDRLFLVRAKDGIEGFVDEPGLRFWLFDDNTRTRLQTNKEEEEKEEEEKLALFMKKS